MMTAWLGLALGHSAIGSPLCVNELAPSNLSSLQAADDSTPDWVELHNASDEPLPLEGFGLSEDPAGPFAPLAGSAAARGFVVVTEDDLGFGLAATGDRLAMQAPDGTISVISFGPVEPDHTLARTTDCCTGDCWIAQHVGTPAQTNVPQRWIEVLAAGSTVRTAPTAAEDWTELGFDDTAWATAPAGQDGAGPQQHARIVVTLPAAQRLALQLTYRDGVVVWFDGVEVYRDNIDAELGVAPTAAHEDKAEAWIGSLHPATDRDEVLIAVYAATATEDTLARFDLQLQAEVEP